MRKENDVDKLDDKTFSIIVNARPEEVEREELSFDELVDLAFDDPARGPQIVFTITFRGLVVESEKESWTKGNGSRCVTER